MKIKLIGCLLFSFTLTLIAAAVEVDEHTVALWLFDEGEGKVVKDLSGNGNDGKIMGGIKWVNGKFGFGLQGNGADGYVLVPDSDSLDLTEGLTIEMWLYLNNYSTAGGNGVTKETSYKVGVNSSKKLMLRITSSKGAWAQMVVQSKSDVPLKSWHHVAGTYDSASGEAKLYMDGELVGEGKLGGTIIPNNNPLWICRGQAPFLDGIVDEVRISSVARSQEEIKKSMGGLSEVRPSGKLAVVWGKVKVSR